jgi:hypothetical protein
LQFFMIRPPGALYRASSTTIRSRACPGASGRPSAIYFHICSDDIFTSVIAPGLAQQPCSYYTEAADLHGQAGSLIIMNDWGRNPCIDAPIARGAVYQAKSVWNTMGKMINAKRLVAARSTFSRTGEFLSRAPDQAFYYTFAQYRWGRSPTGTASPPQTTRPRSSRPGPPARVRSS